MRSRECEFQCTALWRFLSVTAVCGCCCGANNRSVTKSGDRNQVTESPSHRLVLKSIFALFNTMELRTARSSGAVLSGAPIFLAGTSTLLWLVVADVGKAL